jgi:hypothetical protein
MKEMFYKDNSESKAVKPPNFPRLQPRKKILPVLCPLRKINDPFKIYSVGARLSPTQYRT